MKQKILSFINSAALMCVAVSVAVLIWYSLGIGWYRIEEETSIINGGFFIKVKIWNNAEIVGSNTVFDVPAKDVTKTQKQLLIWADSSIEQIKRLKTERNNNN